MADLNTVKARLAALLAKARDAGSTPAEVETAIAAAMKISEKYGVTEDDLNNATADDFRHVKFNPDPGRDKHCPVLRYVGPAIAKFTGTKLWVNGGISGEMNWLGMESDVELALWLWKSLRQFMDDQWAVYKRTEMRDMEVMRKDIAPLRIAFIRNFCFTVADRLNTMATREGGGTETGTALVVLKHQVVAKRLDDMGIHLNKNVSASGKGRADDRAAGAGRAAGAAASLGRGVGQTRAAIGYRA